jgi:hypothetical protein
MANHPRTGAPKEPPRPRHTKDYPIPAHDPAQDDARALDNQVQQHQTIRTELTPGGPLQDRDPSDAQPNDPGTP